MTNATKAIDSTCLLYTSQARGLTQKGLAAVAGMAESTLLSRLDGCSPFTTREIRRMVDWLEIPPEEIGVYFFAEKV